MRDVRRALRALAELEPGELPVLSVYLDMRPHATGESPGLRAGTVILRNRLREIEKTYLPRGAELDSVRQDAERIDRYLMVGGLNQASYQRHNANMRAEFARETASELERLVKAEGASRVVLAGDAVAIPLLQRALTPGVAALVKDVLRLDIRVPLDEVAEEVQQVLAQAEAEDGQLAGDRLVGAVRAGGLGIAGLDATHIALEHGQVDELLLDPTAELDEATRGELVRQASLTGATVEVVEGHDGLRRMGGVGALLRYRHD
jgi:hypothetical protein